MSEPLSTTPTDWIDISLSPLPKLGETAELTFTSQLPSFSSQEDANNSQAWVVFSYANHKGSYSEAKYAVPVPLDEVLINGDLSWEGNLFENGFPEMTATIQLPREGIWIIQGYFSVKSWGKSSSSCMSCAAFGEREKPLMESNKLIVLVTEDAAVLMNTPEFKSSPFGYLANFDYGRIGKRVPDESNPVVLELDISKVPRAGEEVILTCRIDSIIDWADYFAKFRFGKRGDDNRITFMTGDSLLVDGNLSWEGDLKKNEPVEFSATIKFPDDGDWMVEVLGDHPKYPGNFLADAIKMNINGEIGSFGWEGYP